MMEYFAEFLGAMIFIKEKRDCDWSYAWIPFIGPIIGSSLAAFALGIESFSV